MSESLDDLLGELAKKGELNYLSVIPITRKSFTGFHASYAPATNCGHGFGEDVDPASAIRKAIKDWDGQRKDMKRRARADADDMKAASNDKGDDTEFG